jgi:ribulose-5-phosphate 4-epimerase/fuculose-1-phosphate aldolase
VEDVDSPAVPMGFAAHNPSYETTRFAIPIDNEALDDTQKKDGSMNASAADAPPVKDLLDQLVLANKILFQLNVVDAFGHISVRHDKDSKRYLMSRHLPPVMVTAADIATFDLDSNPLTHSDKPQYSERFIHGEIYKVRPEVLSVVHCHARPLIPFGVAKGAKLRPMFHMCGFLGCGVPIFEIRKAGGMTDMLIRTPELGKALAASLDDKFVVLMRGHGATMVGQSIPEAVFRAVYAMENATIQMQAHQLAEDGEVEFLSAEESAKSGKGRNVMRAWALWKHQFSSTQ